MALAEKTFENKVKDYLESIGCYAFGTPKDQLIEPITGYWEKRWGGGQFAKSGLPDMHIVLHGCSIEAELKAPTGKPSKLQLKNLDLINRSSLGFILVESNDTKLKLIKWIKNTYPEYGHISVWDFNDFKFICDKFVKKTIDIVNNI